MFSGKQSGLFRRCPIWVAALTALRLCALQVRADELAGDELGSASGLGPLFAQFPLTLADGTGTEALGPFFRQEVTVESESWAVPPLISSFTAPERERREVDALYPVMTHDRFGTEWRGQLLQVFSLSGGDTQAGARQRRLTVFPFYWQLRSTEPAENYTALWPLRGELRNRLLRDEISFTLWPLYVRTFRARGAVETWNVPAPFVHVRRGEGLRGWQVWPLVGHEAKVPTNRTNSWGDVELSPGHRKTFALWPLWLNETRGVGTTNQSELRSLLPVFSTLRSPGRDSTSFLPPIGLTLTEDRARRFTETYVLWPVFGRARGAGKYMDRIWPLYGNSQTPRGEKQFALWPLYQHALTKSPTLERERTRLLFWLYSDAEERRLTTGQSTRRVDVWPLFTHGRRLDGSSRLQILAPLEPLIPNHRGIERNWSPLWSLWRSENNPAAQRSSRSLLWNLYRRDAAPELTRTSCLFGLVQHARTGRGTGLRVLFIPLKSLPAVAPGAALPHAGGDVPSH